MLFGAWEGKPPGPTKDLDLPGLGSPDMEQVAATIREICLAEADDGLEFERARAEAWRIKEGAEYESVRAAVPASLDGARVKMQIDVGFGDLVAPAPQAIRFPALLAPEAPRARAHPPEAVAAE